MLHNKYPYTIEDIIMGCLSIATVAINAQKSIVDASTTSYETALSSLRSLNPKNFDTRASFESAKKTANASVKSSLATLNSAIDSLKSISSVLSPVDGTDVESISTLTDAAHLAIMATTIATVIAAVVAAAPFGIPVPPTPALPGAISLASAAMQGLQC